MLTRRNKRNTKSRIGTLKKGLLTKFGYQNVTQLSQQERHEALKKAIRAYGALSVFRKLNAVYVYNRKTNPSHSKIFKTDSLWVRQQF